MVVIRSPRDRSMLWECVLASIPDAFDVLIARAATAYTNGGIVGFLEVILGLQCLYFVLWVKRSIWLWIRYCLVGRKNMTTHFLVYAVFLSNVALAADRDALVALMDDGRGEKSIHVQPVEHEGCMGLIANLKRLQKEHQKMELTVTDPPFSGYVVDLHCVRPDGKVIGRNGIVKTR